MKRWILLISVLWMTACSSQPQQQSAPEPTLEPAGATLASLEPVILQPPDARRNDIGIEELIGNYEVLFNLQPDPDVQMLSLDRLADLRLELSETQIYSEGQIPAEHLTRAREGYEIILQQSPGREGNDRVLYQLAKIQELQGDQVALQATLARLLENHPESRYGAETWFRRGEFHFANGDYDWAESAFSAARATGEPQYQVNAAYMVGWSQFKLGEYPQSLRAWLLALDGIIPEAGEVENIADHQRTLAEDIFRVMGFTFTYIGGADAIAPLFAEAGPRRYEWLIYDRYAQNLREQELFTDAIAVYRAYIARYPLSERAPRYQDEIIATLAEADFLSERVAEKERFVLDYGPGSDYWELTPSFDLVYVETQLRGYLPELASIYHSLGQRQLQALEGDQALEADELLRVSGRTIVASASSARSDLLRAADFYTAYTTSFPTADDVPAKIALKAQALHEAGETLKALETWEVAAYDYPQWPGRRDAAWAALVTYAELIAAEGQSTQTLSLLREQEDAARLRFAEQFPDDPQTPEVLYSSAAWYFSREDYPAVLDLTQRIQYQTPASSADMVAEAQLLEAHALFAMADYPAAEQAYARAATGIDPADPRQANILANQSASIYRQAEALLAAGAAGLAIGEFLRVADLNPDSDIARAARFDAINQMVQDQAWEEAIPAIRDYRERYPEHDSTRTLQPSLVLGLRETGQPGPAADELAPLADQLEPGTRQAELLMITAGLYQDAGQWQKARDYYRRHANAYPQPVEDYLLSASALAELYAQLEDLDRRRFWLRKQIATVEQLPAPTPEQSHQASAAAVWLAEEQMQNFTGISLSAPLKQSIARKTQAMRGAISAWNQVLAFGVAEHSTEAGHQLGVLYARFSQDLLQAEAPSGLTDLELAQYVLLVEEQAYPFEENAIDLFEQNVMRTREGLYDKWIQASFTELSNFLPIRYAKEEIVAPIIDTLP